jgi:hypothetical protein
MNGAMKRTTREIWSERVRRWQTSGLSAAAFAAREGVNAKTLSFWRWNLGQKKARRPSAVPAVVPQAADFIELVAPSKSVPRHGSPFEVSLGNGTRLVVPSLFDERALESLLSVLEAR